MVDVNGEPERTWDRNELRRPQIQVVLNPEIERLCQVWAEVGRAVLARRREHGALVQ